MHRKCFVCGHENCSGLGIQYALNEHGEVVGSFFAADEYQDLHGLCHRGIIITLLDSVMVHTLLQQNLKGLTSTLDAQFIKPIPTGSLLTISGSITEIQRDTIYHTIGKVAIGDEVYAQGTAKFMRV